jgi:ADP-ribose pyrophosphatase
MKPDSRRAVYEGRVVSLVLEQWGPHEREVLEHPGAVVVVATDADGRVVLVRQLRQAVRRELLELPAGTLDGVEDPLEAARRELAEETGFGGGSWRPGPAFFTAPGFCNERMSLFFAKGVSPGTARPEEDEVIEVVLVPADEVSETLGEIEDAKSLVGLLLYLRDRG